MEITVKKIGETEKEYIEIGCHKKDERIDEIIEAERHDFYEQWFQYIEEYE